MLKQTIFTLCMALFFCFGTFAQSNLNPVTSDNADQGATAITEKAFSELQIYPNPARGSFTFDFSGLTGTVVCDILNRMGQSVYSETFTRVEDQPVQSCFPGALNRDFYFVVIHNDNTRIVKRLMIE